MNIKEITYETTTLNTIKHITCYINNVVYERGRRMNKLLSYIIKKLVTLYYKKYPFCTYSWGIDEFTDLHIMSETFDVSKNIHRFGLRETELKLKGENE